MSMHRFRCKLCRTSFKADLQTHAFRSLPTCTGCGVSVNEGQIVIPWQTTKKVGRGIKRVGLFTGKWTTAPAWAPPYYALYRLLYKTVLCKGGGAFVWWHISHKAYKRMLKLEKKRAIDDRVADANAAQRKEEAARKQMMEQGTASLQHGEELIEKYGSITGAFAKPDRRAFPVPSAMSKMQATYICKYCGAIWPTVERMRTCQDRHPKTKAFSMSTMSEMRQANLLLGGMCAFGKSYPSSMGRLVGIRDNKSAVVACVGAFPVGYSELLSSNDWLFGGLYARHYCVEVPFSESQGGGSGRIEVEISRPNYLLREGACSPEYLIDKQCLVLSKQRWIKGHVRGINVNKEQKAIMNVDRANARIPCLRRPELELLVDVGEGFGILDGMLNVTDVNSIYILEG